MNQLRSSQELTNINELLFKHFSFKETKELGDIGKVLSVKDGIVSIEGFFNFLGLNIEALNTNSALALLLGEESLALNYGFSLLSSFLFILMLTNFSSSQSGGENGSCHGSGSGDEEDIMKRILKFLYENRYVIAAGTVLVIAGVVCYQYGLLENCKDLSIKTGATAGVLESINLTIDNPKSDVPTSADVESTGIVETAVETNTNNTTVPVETSTTSTTTTSSTRDSTNTGVPSEGTPTHSNVVETTVSSSSVSGADVDSTSTTSADVGTETSNIEVGSFPLPATIDRNFQDFKFVKSNISYTDMPDLNSSLNKLFVDKTVNYVNLLATGKGKGTVYYPNGTCLENVNSFKSCRRIFDQFIIFPKIESFEFYSKRLDLHKFSTNPQTKEELKAITERFPGADFLAVDYYDKNIHFITLEELQDFRTSTSLQEVLSKLEMSYCLKHKILLNFQGNVFSIECRYETARILGYQPLTYFRFFYYDLDHGNVLNKMVIRLSNL